MAIDLSTLSDREALSAIYIGYYNRAADPAGIAFWEQVVNDTSLNLVNITSDFAGQTETQTVHPFFANPTEDAAGTFITTLYLNLFNREPDDAGLAFWTNELQAAVAGARDADDPNPDAPLLTVGQIITSIIEGAEDIEGGTQDRTTILNKINVASDWTTSAIEANADFDGNTAVSQSAADIIKGVTEDQATVDAALATTDSFFAIETEGVTLDLGFGTFDFTTGTVAGFDNLAGTADADTFRAEDGALVSGDRIDGGGSTDVLTAFLESNGSPISAITTSVETVVITNQQNSDQDSGDNNIAGFNGNGIDIEIDGGRMVGVDRWENFDSRADLVIEDARDNDDRDGTFTDDITVAMVSTDPGNVDYAVYFDNPVNTSTAASTLVVEVIDQESAQTFSSASVAATTTGVLTESRLEGFSFTLNGNEINIELPDSPEVFGATATYQSLALAIQTAVDANAQLQALGETLTVELSSNTFDEAASLDNTGSGSIVFGLQIEITSDSGGILVELETDSRAVDPDTDIAARVTADTIENTELITLNVELDDVGKGSMGGDALFGAMSTGRQTFDDGTSNSVGIEQFNIEVDRSSQLQTINSTNNTLQVVNIVNGENDGPNNTQSTFDGNDETIGDLVVRGQANPAGTSTDNSLPGADPQHNGYGFSDVRVINAAAMVGDVDLTAELTEEIVEKYLNIQDGETNGELDDVTFAYTLGTMDDEFFLNMEADALVDAGTGSREDFNMTTSGGTGDDVITTNVGTSNKRIDDQGEDHYVMTTDNGANWYENSVFANAATFTVDGGAGNDTIWTHGWGDKTISDGTGDDVVYTDNSGVLQNSAVLLTEIDRPLNEDDQIDYVIGATWSFNNEAASNGGGATNEDIVLRTGLTATTVNSGFAEVIVSYSGVGGDATVDATGVYTATATINTADLKIVGTELRTTEQAYNQAIKDAINTDPVLRELMEAVDGAGNSLIVYTKTDGLAVIDNLDVEIADVTFDGTTSTSATVRPAGYDIPGPVGVGFSTNTVTDSDVESDNTINMAADGNSDVIVLSTSDTSAAQPTVNGALDSAFDLNGASNEELIFADGNFGSDTIVNFDEVDAAPSATNQNQDVMDFLHIDYTGVFGAVADDSIFVLAETGGTNSTTAEVATTYNTLLAGEEAIHIAFDVADDNTGIVYDIVGVGAGTDATVTVVGEISLIGTDWSLLTADNFA